MNIADTIEKIRKQILLKEALIVMLNQLADKIPFDVSHSVTHNMIDFDFPSNREVVTKLMQCIAGGKWEKELCGNDKINYTNKTFKEGITLRIYGAPPPPLCRIVEEEVEVPFQPAHKTKRRKLVCM